MRDASARSTFLELRLKALVIQPRFLLVPQNQKKSKTTATDEMQNHILAVCEMIKIYDAAIRRAHKVHDRYRLSGLE